MFNFDKKFDSFLITFFQNQTPFENIHQSRISSVATATDIVSIILADMVTVTVKWGWGHAGTRVGAVAKRYT